MITCPWCGTNYIAFQPNCKNCGGLLEPVAEGSPAAVEEPIPTPPPPPRAIADSYAWKLVLADGWGVVGGVFVLLGVIFCGVGVPLTIGLVTAFVGIPFFGLGALFLGGGVAGLVWRYQEALKVVNVLRRGEATQGQIIGLHENLNVSVNEQHPWTIAYQYSVGGQVYQGKVTTLQTPGPQLQPGKAACVLYLPEAPASSALYPHP